MAKSSGMPEGVKTVLYWGIGIGVLAFTLLILLIIFGNLSGNVGFSQDTVQVNNHTVLLSAVAANITDLTGKVNPGITNVILTNATRGETVNVTNYTFVGGNLLATGDLLWNNTNVNVSGLFAYDEQGKIDTDNLILNYSLSATNTAKQFPTVGTILGIALLLVILIGILIFAVRKLMGATSAIGGGGGNSLGGGSSKFKGSSNADFG